MPPGTRSVENSRSVENAVLTLALIGFVGGLITGISPCILPVLPVIFLSGGAQGARNLDADAAADAGWDRTTGHIPTAAERRAAAGATTTLERPTTASTPATRRASRRPYLVVAGLALSFSIFTLLGTIILSLLGLPQDLVRWLGLAILVILGLGLLFPRFEAILEKPFSRIPQRAVSTDRGGFVLGLALGAVYVPCAGPVLAAITVAGATGKIGVQTLVLTVAFAVGTALPLLFFALAGRQVAERVRAFRTHQRLIRVIGGIVMIGLAVALTFNVTDAIQRAIPDYTASLNASAGTGTVGSALTSGDSKKAAASASKSDAVPLTTCQNELTTTLENCGSAPAISGIQQWLNTPSDKALSIAGEKGKVVLVDFWAYSCINCQRAITHLTAWNSKYKGDGLEIIGVHTPEYAFEHVPTNVQAGAARLGITYPIAIDNNYTTWDSYQNDSWPADYLIDSTGEVRHVQIGEGNYGSLESMIRTLLKAAKPGLKLPAATDVPDLTPTNPRLTPESYLGLARSEYYVGSTQPTAGTAKYSLPSSLPLSSYGLGGTWTASQQSIKAGADARITLNFDARYVYLDVGGTGTVTSTIDGKTTTFDVKGAPNIYTVVDRGSEGTGLVHLTLSPGLSAYSFTFG